MSNELVLKKAIRPHAGQADPQHTVVTLKERTTSNVPTVIPRKLICACRQVHEQAD